MSKCSGLRGQEALTCLQKNVETLSPGCKTAVSKTLPKPPPVAAPAPAAPAPVQAAPAAPKPAPAPVTAAPPAPVAPPPTVAAPAPATQPVAKPPAHPRPATAAKPPAPKVAKPAPPKPAAPAPQTPSAPPPADTAGPTPQQMNALKFTCGRDFSKVCKGVPAGGAEALDCLQRNNARLSPNCKTSLADIVDSLPAGGMPAAPAAAAPAAAPPQSASPIDAAVMIRACKLDLVRHCRDAGLGDGKKLACLNQHMSDLTIRCRTALKVTAPIR